MTEKIEASTETQELDFNPESILNSRLLIKKRGRPSTPLRDRSRQMYREVLENMAKDAHDRNPKLAEWMQETGTDGLHGTRSGSLQSIMEHGLIPQSEHEKFSYPVISQEFHSLASPRDNIHMVHWLFAGGTRQFTGEVRGDDSITKWELLNPNDIDSSLIRMPEVLEMMKGSESVHGRHFYNRHVTAVALREYLESDAADPEHVAMLKLDAPVVLGINTSKLDRRRLKFQPSIITGDVAYSSSIPLSAITGVFTPQSVMVQVAKYTDKPVLPLEDLRSMTEELLEKHRKNMFGMAMARSLG